MDNIQNNDQYEPPLSFFRNEKSFQTDQIRSRLSGSCILTKYFEFEWALIAIICVNGKYLLIIRPVLVATPPTRCQLRPLRSSPKHVEFKLEAKIHFPGDLTKFFTVTSDESPV